MKPPPPRSAASLFIDSGAFSLYTQKGKTDPSFYSFEKGSEFRTYLDRYARFMEKVGSRVLFANVDVIYNPQLTWDVQKFFEEYYGLFPVPVVHYRTPLSWVDRYLHYDLLGVGGFAWGGPDTTQWLDNFFLHICPSTNNRLPVIKVHGFALTSWHAICRWPWWSVDSTTWFTTAAFGGILVPRWKGESWRYDKPPLVIQVSGRSTSIQDYGRHYNSLPQLERQIITRWLESIGTSLAEVRGDGCKPGRGNDPSYIARSYANLTYFKNLEESRPVWPHPLDTRVVRPHRLQYGKGFGL